jgi:hypothetical protein
MHRRPDDGTGLADDREVLAEDEGDRLPGSPRTWL